MMHSHLAMPRGGYLKEVLHIFDHLKKHHSAEMVFDPSDRDLDMSKFPKKDWSYSIYFTPSEELKELLTSNMTISWGKYFTIPVFLTLITLEIV